MLADLRSPGVTNIIEGRASCNIEQQQEALGTPKIRGGDTAESIVPRGVPHLQLHIVALQSTRPDPKINPDRDQVGLIGPDDLVRRQLLVAEPLEEAALPHATVAADHQLQQVSVLVLSCCVRSHGLEPRPQQCLAAAVAPAELGGCDDVTVSYHVEDGAPEALASGCVGPTSAHGRGATKRLRIQPAQHALQHLVGQVLRSGRWLEALEGSHPIPSRGHWVPAGGCGRECSGVADSTLLVFRSLFSSVVAVGLASTPGRRKDCGKIVSAIN